AHFRSSQRTIQTRPSVVVNARSFVFQSRLFIQSRMMAGNDDVETFERSSVIDVYNVLEGSYIFSFYVPDLNGHALNDFMVIRDMIIVLYDDHLTTYKIGKTAHLSSFYF